MHVAEVGVVERTFQRRLDLLGVAVDRETGGAVVCGRLLDGQTEVGELLGNRVNVRLHALHELAGAEALELLR